MDFKDLANRVRNIPLVDVVRKMGLPAKTEGKSIRIKTDKFNIVITGQKFFDNYDIDESSGGAIDFVAHINGVTPANAIRWLAREFIGENADVFQPPVPPEPKIFSMEQYEIDKKKYAPRDDSHWKKAFDYLTQVRNIPFGLVSDLHLQGQIYSNDRAGVVFLHRDENGNEKGLSIRPTYHNSAWRMSVGSKLEAWFYIGDFKTASSIVVTEAPIDALSFYALHHEPGQLVLAAGFNHVPEKVLSLAKSHGLAVFCALDNDKGGEEGHQHLLETYKENPFQSSEPKRLLPKLKDWSEDIMLFK